MQATIAAGGGGAGLAEQFAMFKELMHSPLEEKLLTASVDKMLAAPVAAPAAAAAPADDGAFMNLLSTLMTKLGGGGNPMATPAGAFAGPTGGAQVTPDAPPPPPPASPAEPATPVHPPPQVVDVDPPAPPKPVTEADLSEHVRGRIDDLPQDQAAVVGNIVIAAQTAANEGNSPALAEIMFRFLEVCKAGGLNDEQLEQIERDPGRVVDDLSNFVDCPPGVMAEARGIVVEEMAATVAMRAEQDQEQAVNADSTD
jgi:hypothetical protein